MVNRLMAYVDNLMRSEKPVPDVAEAGTPERQCKFKIGERIRWTERARGQKKYREHDDVGIVESIKFWPDSETAISVRFPARPDVNVVYERDLVLADDSDKR